jgi:hypothetical protein
VGSQLRRRRLAAYRCEPLPHSRRRDPWGALWRPERLSAVQIDAAVDAAAHLVASGLSPRFDDATLRSMWKAGHRRLVDKLREAA